MDPKADNALYVCNISKKKKRVNHAHYLSWNGINIHSQVVEFVVLSGTLTLMKQSCD